MNHHPPNTAKFKVGDKVRLNRRTPAYLTQGLRQRTRTIVGVTPQRQGVGRDYFLGAQGKGLLTGIWGLRSYMLDPVPPNPPLGRPRKNGQNSH